MPELPTAPLGVHLDPHRPGCATAAVFAAHADAVEVALVDPAPGGGWRERRVPLQRARHGVWSGVLDAAATGSPGGVRAGQRYGLRVHGPWNPARGHRHDPASLLLDPYARALAGEVVWGPEVFAHAVDPDTWRPVPGPHRPSGLDSAAHVPHGVLLDTPPVDATARPRVPWGETVVYEAHVRGLTADHPDLPPELRGTYAGLAHPAVVEHLVALGATSLELLPVHAIADEVALVRRGMRNHWGYNTLSWFAPEPRYATAAARAAGPAAVVAELRDAVAALHAAGLEVLLDVVYNHSCEGGGDGPALSLRGIDAASYYRLDPRGWDVDTTGCGNSLDAGHPRVVQLVLDSLRHWVSAYGVDGFRFDLAPTLARGRDGRFTAEHAFLVAAAADPALADVKLIAEPWDLGVDGWRTGGFTAPFAEWNDRFRDAAREFWLADARRLSFGQVPGNGLRELATRFSGSADLFGPGDRGPLASVSFVTAHDGFTLADLTAHEHKVNAANGEDGRDGTDDNRSWNHGSEGWDDHPLPEDVDPDVELRHALRRRSMRNLLATLLLSAGVPMITMGDETGRTQGGNNNPYCLDGPVNRVSWRLAPWQEDLLATTRALTALRREHPALRPVRQPTGLAVHEDGTTDLAWFDVDGSPMVPQRWDDPRARTVQVFLHGAPSGSAGAVLVVVHGDLDDGEVRLPPAPWGTGYRALWDSAEDRPPAGPGEALRPGQQVLVSALSVRVFAVDRA